MHAKPALFLALLVAVAFGIRLGAVFALRDVRSGPAGAPCADDVEFNRLAQHVAAGRGFVHDDGQPTSFRAPGWPLFLAGVYALVGTHAVAGYLVLCGLGAVSCLLTYLLARAVLDERASRLAAVLLAVYLPHVWFSTMFLSEALFVVCLALGLWLFLRHLHGGSAWLLAAAGLVLGWAALTRPFALLLLPALCVVQLVAQRSSSPLPCGGEGSGVRGPSSSPLPSGGEGLGVRGPSSSPLPSGGERGARHHRRLRPVAVLLLPAAALAVVLPWTVRNARVHGRPVLIATNGGSTFYGGNNGRVVHEPRLWGSWVSTTDLPHRDWIDATPDEVAHDQMEWQLGKQWLRDNPGWLPALVGFKTARLGLGLPDFDGGRRWYYAVRSLAYAPFLLLFVLGAARCLRQRLASPAWLALHGTLLATLLTALVFWGSPRFRDANAPVLMIYAALGAQMLLGLRARPARDPVPAATAARCPAVVS